MRNVIGPQSNQDVFNSTNVIAAYESVGALLPPEARILGALEDWLRTRAVLDLGVGTGRTTSYLLSRCRRYVGVDYALGMVEQCRTRFPGADFRHADATDLREFAADEFDLVMFSFNGIDYVDAAGRERVLREVWRVLRPTGLLAFSSHNLHHQPSRPRWLPDFVPSNNPVISLKRLLSSLRYGITHQRNYRANRHREVHANGMAWRVDSAHDFRLLTCYTTPEEQDRRLREVGFRLFCVLDAAGQLVPAGARPAEAWLHYVAGREKSEFPCGGNLHASSPGE